MLILIPTLRKLKDQSFVVELILMYLSMLRIIFDKSVDERGNHILEVFPFLSSCSCIWQHDSHHNLVSISIWCFGLNSSIFFCTIKENDLRWKVARMNLTSLRSDPRYATVNLVTNTVVVGELALRTSKFLIFLKGIFPILLLCYLNWRIIRVSWYNFIKKNIY